MSIDGPGPTEGVPTLAARGLTKLFSLGMLAGKKKVHSVEDLDLNLFHRQVIALVGESGSGKSTVARLLAQILPAT